MPSPVPRHLRKERPDRFSDHVCDLVVRRPARALAKSRHPAKYAPGLPTALVDLAGTSDVGDPFAGVGRLAEETGIACALNEIDPRWRGNLLALQAQGCVVSFGDASDIPWQCDTLIFSPPYYPRTDRKKIAAHDDAKRGAVVGYRSGYGCALPGFIGDPCGVDGILIYRKAMRKIFEALRRNGRRAIVVTKNTVRLGTELRLDHDTILTAKEVGWEIVSRHGWKPPPSMWARYNKKRGHAVEIEDVLIFERLGK